MTVICVSSIPDQTHGEGTLPTAYVRMLGIDGWSPHKALSLKRKKSTIATQDHLKLPLEQDIQRAFKNQKVGYLPLIPTEGE